VKLGVVADVHGNVEALRAVVADAASMGGVDRWWALGDLVLFGPRPAETMELLLTLPSIVFVRGNTDRYVLTGAQPHPHAVAADAVGDLDLVERFGAMAAHIGWTRGVLTQAGLLDELDRFQESVRTVLPDGTRVLGIHASPKADDGPGIEPDVPDDVLAPLIAGCDADIVVGGHTHVSTDRVVEGVRLVNGGSTGMPRRALGACWLLIDAVEDKVDVQRRVVEFGIDAVVADLHDRRHPGAAFVSSILRREHAFAH
jgi:predicted phosphodiesterase